VLGRKWALRVLMDIALGKAERFNELRRSAPEMSKRILALRLRELEANGFVTRAEDAQKHTVWRITAKGSDVLPVLLTLIHYGVRWHPNETPFEFEKGKLFEVTYTNPRGETRSKVAEADHGG
jgi:DNA-binding HxlR family transcriptional regulator